ncbi:MAG: hypothetical protein IPI73_12645 [Betaproteobacteria bacterium]|nr:hypothetical protein [Betaproteobacteria bacterium]
MGATVTGLDFSLPAIEGLAPAVGGKQHPRTLRPVQRLPRRCGGAGRTFDIVYTGIGGA